MAITVNFATAVGQLGATAKKTFPTDPTKRAISYAFDLAGKLGLTLASTTANNEVGGGDLIAGGVLDIVAGGTATLDLQAMTDILEQTAQSFARLKFCAFWLPATADDANIGTDATSVAIGNGGANANQLFLGADAHTILLKNGGWAVFGDKSAAGLTVGATNKDVLVTNADVDTAAKLVYLFGGGKT